MIDFYDVSQALVGFQRSLALTTHLVLNGEVITQAPSLKGARVLALPPEAGSWKFTAWILAGATGLYSLGTTENNSPIGHIVYSLYDYIVSESLGVHVDYDKSLGRLYEEAQRKKIKIPIVRESQADSLMEKTERALVEMHRPIVQTESARNASIVANFDGWPRPIQTTLDIDTFEFIHETRTSDFPIFIEGRVSSYNSNTYKGRIYVVDYGRSVTFELSPASRSPNSANLITTSLHHSATRQFDRAGVKIYCIAYERTSRSGHLKSLLITNVSSRPFE